MPYDTPFVYAEVNADEVIWLFGDGRVQEILAHNSNSIGKKISTKRVGSEQCQDITSFYKYPEGTRGPGDLGTEVGTISFVLPPNGDGSQGFSGPWPYGPRAGLLDLANKNTGCPVKFELQITKYFISITMSQIVHVKFLY